MKQECALCKHQQYQHLMRPYQPYPSDPNNIVPVCTDKRLCLIRHIANETDYVIDEYYDEFFLKVAELRHG